MSEETHVAPAGVSEPLSMSAAAEALAAFDAPEEEQASPEETAEPSNSGAENEPVEAASDDGLEPEADPDASEDDASPAEEAEPETEPTYEFDKVHGNTKFRLRDGREVTKSQLIREWGDLAELRAQAPQLSAAQQRLQAQAANLAQQNQLLSQALPVAMSAIEAQIPKAPDPSLLQSDPLAYVEQKELHEMGRLKLERMKAYLAQQHEALVQKLPDLGNPEKSKALAHSFVETANRYGFSQDEVARVADHRLLHMVHDLSSKAAAYDKLMAERASAKTQAQAKVAKAAPAAPVQQPGRRVSGAEVQSKQREAQVQQVRNRGGRLEDVARLLADF